MIIIFEIYLFTDDRLPKVQIDAKARRGAADFQRNITDSGWNKYIFWCSPAVPIKNLMGFNEINNNQKIIMPNYFRECINVQCCN